MIGGSGVEGGRLSDDRVFCILASFLPDMAHLKRSFMVDSYWGMPNGGGGVYHQVMMAKMVMMLMLKCDEVFTCHYYQGLLVLRLT